MWVSGVVIAKGFWSVFASVITGGLWSLYLILKKVLIFYGVVGVVGVI